MRVERAGIEDSTERIAALVNEVYAVAESGMWREGAERTTSSEIESMLRAGEIVVARDDGRIVGCVRVQDVAARVGEFGMLAAAPGVRGAGVGRALLDFVEDDARARGLETMQLEILVPREWTHPSKEFLRGWYGRRGYRLVRTGRLDEAYPHLAPLLATACDFEIHEKRLRG